MFQVILFYHTEEEGCKEKSYIAFAFYIMCFISGVNKQFLCFAIFSTDPTRNYSQADILNLLLCLLDSLSESGRLCTSIERCRQQWENLGLDDDFLFGKVMQDEKLCRELL